MITTAKQRHQPGVHPHRNSFWESVAKSIPLSNGLAALLITGLQELFNHITDCPCNFGVAFGWLTLLGPVVIMVVSLATPVWKACGAQRDHAAGTRLARYVVLTFVASVVWLCVALLNSKAVCCIRGGYPGDSPCLHSIANYEKGIPGVVQNEECISDSRLAGVIVMMVGGATSAIILGVVHVKYGRLGDNGNGDWTLETLNQSRNQGHHSEH
ncbi:uncharacterized protein LOC133360784 [Lethenteron reissneri]|uniref:uncharacterized protein LOC133360784 n=1 Tax=Lethenteron reissneri TaxID=7753 RepID=UPI002AB69588|nr:uncharacterized protein LOC133360784 [Lethenteron reissneri]